MVAVSLGGTWRGEKDEYRIEQSRMAPSFQLPPVTLGSPGPYLRVYLGFLGGVMCLLAVPKACTYCPCYTPKETL